MRKLISFCLYGDSATYQQGAVENAKLAHVIYPGWSCRFYVSQEIPISTIGRLQQENAEIPQRPKGPFDSDQQVEQKTTLSRGPMFSEVR